MTEVTSKVIQVSNLSPSVTKEQLETFFEYVGRVRELKLYPEGETFGITPTKVAYVKYDSNEKVQLALHLTNTVMVDNAMIILPYIDDEIPPEKKGLRVSAPSNAVAGMLPPTAQWPMNVVNMICGTGMAQTIQTIDPKLSELGLAPYPPLAGNTDPSKMEEIRRTVYASNLDPAVTAEQLLQFFTQSGEVRYVRMAGDADMASRNAFIEFTCQRSVHKSLAFSGTMLNGRALKVSHSLSVISNKPQSKSEVAVAKEIDEAMKRVKEAQPFITAAVGSTSYGSSSKRSRSKDRRRSHSRKHSRSRHRSRSRRRDRRRSRSRGRRRHSRTPTKSYRSSRRSRTPSSKAAIKPPGAASSRRRSRSRRKSKSPRSTRRRSRSRDRRRSRSKDRSRRSRSRERDRKRSKSRDRRKRSKSRERLQSKEIQSAKSKSKERQDGKDATVDEDQDKGSNSGSPARKESAADAMQELEKKVAVGENGDAGEKEGGAGEVPKSEGGSPPRKAGSASPARKGSASRSRSKSKGKKSKSRSRSRSGSRKDRLKFKKRSRSRSPRRRLSRHRSRSPRGRRSRSKGRRPSRSPRRRSPPRRKSRSRRRSRSGGRKSRSPTKLRRSRSPHGRRSKSPRSRISRSPRRRSRERERSAERRKKRRDGRDRSRSADLGSARKRSRRDKNSPESKDSKVRRNYDEEEKGFDSGDDGVGKRKSKGGSHDGSPVGKRAEKERLVSPVRGGSQDMDISGSDSN